MTAEAQKDVKRQYLIVVAAIVLGGLVLIYVIYTFIAKPKMPVSQVSAITTAGSGSTTEESQHYRKTLQNYNDSNAADAAKRGKSYLSVLSTSETAAPAASASASPSAPGPATFVAPPPSYQPPPSSYGGRWLSKSDQASLQGLLAQWQGNGIAVGSVIDAKDFAESLAPPAADSHANALQAAARDALANTVIVPPYAQTYAELLTEIDTDEPSMVRAVVPPGMPFAGAELFASTYKRLNRDVDLTFDAMVYQGHAYKITAKPLDMRSSRTALSGEVKHHYFSRIVLPALASGVAATGQLFAQADQTTVVTPQGGIVATTPSTPSVRNIAGTMVGGIGQTTSQVIGQEAAQIPIKETIVRKGEIIGIQFIGSVVAADDLALSKAGQGVGGEPSAGTTETPTGVDAPQSRSPAASAAAPPAPRPPSGIRYYPSAAAAAPLQ